MPPIFSSNRIAPIGAVDAEVRADADLAEAAGAVVGGERAAQVLLAALGARARRPRRRGTSARRRRRRRRAGDERMVKRIAPVAPVSMRAGEDLAAGHVALAVGVDPGAALDAAACRSVPSASMRSSRAPRRRSISASWKRAELAPRRATGSGWSRNSARSHERGEVVPRPCRPAAAPAGVGHSVEHQRFFSVRSRTGAPRPGDARDPRRVDAGELARVVGRLDRRGPRRAFLASASASGVEVVELQRRARARRSRAPGRAARRAAAARRRARRIARCSSSSSGAASVVERTSTCWRGCTSRQ